MEDRLHSGAGPPACGLVADIALLPLDAKLGQPRVIVPRQHANFVTRAANCSVM